MHYVSVYVSIAKVCAHPQSCRMQRETLVFSSTTPSLIPKVLSVKLELSIFLARLVASKSKQSAVSCLQSVGLPPDMHFSHLAILIKKELETYSASV